MRLLNVQIWVGIALAIALTACASPTYHSATPIAEDTFNVGVGLAVRGYAGPNDHLIEPAPEIILRKGISENSDLGARVGGSIGVDWNWAFINSPGFALSLNIAAILTLPAFPGGYVGLLADVVKTEDFKLTLGVKPSLVMLARPKEGTDVFGDRDGYYGLAIAGMVGAKFDLGRFVLMPSVNIYAPIESDERLDFAAGVGFYF